MPETTGSDRGRGPRLGRKTPRTTVSRWDRTQYTELRFSELTERIREAEQGKVERWADLTRRMMKTDPDLVSVVQTRLDAVARARYELAPPDAVLDEMAEVAKEAAELCETHCFRELPDFEQAMRDLLDGIGMGFGVAEIVWGRKQILYKGRRVGIFAPVDLIAVHPRRMAYTEDFRLALKVTPGLEIEGMERVATRDGPAVLLPPDKYVVHQPRTILDYPTSTGLFMSVARPWWVKQWVTKYWLSGAEKAANPRVLGKYPQGATNDVREELFDALEAMAADGIGVMADTTALEYLQGNFSGAADVWERLERAQIAKYAKAWLGSTLNVEIGDTGGNRAAAESQADTTIDPRRDRDGQSLWGDLRRHLIEPFVRFNTAPIGDLWSVKPPVPVGRFVHVEDAVEVDKDAIDAGVVTVNELRESRGLSPWPDDRGDRIVQPLARATPDLPPIPVPDASPSVPPELLATEDVQSSALNGAQVSSMLDIVQRVAEGLLPRQSAIEIIVSAFPIDRSQAERILGEVGRTFRPQEPKPQEPKPQEPTAPAPEVGEPPFSSQAAEMMRAMSGRVPTT